MKQFDQPGSLDQFAEIWVVDSEFVQVDGNHPKPVCLAAVELRTGRQERIWFADDEAKIDCPFSLGPETLYVAFAANAELSVHLELAWKTPANVLDLYVEYLRITNGKERVHGSGLLGALGAYGIKSTSAIAKDASRELIVGGGPWSECEAARILDYCADDVAATVALLQTMLVSGHIDLDRSLIRGRYMTAVARMERNGVPIASRELEKLVAHRDQVQSNLISEIDMDYGVYQKGKFDLRRFQEYLTGEGIAWPRLESGTLCLDDGTFKSQSEIHPQLKPLRELRRTLTGLRNNRLRIGKDGRNRVWLNPFGSRTGRNQPSNSQFIFGQPAWWRGFIMPNKEHSLAYLDWDQQEFGIAAALSDDKSMQDAYISGDPYLSFAIQAGAVPEDATKESHPIERDMFKQCVLAVQYGMGAKSLGEKIKKPAVYAQELLSLHRRTYHRFWAWSDDVLETALARGWIETVFGWRCHLPAKPNERMVRNFPMQANGAEMLRLACIDATESEIEVCAPVHDAALIHAPLVEIDTTIEQMRAFMTKASRIVLDGFTIQAGVERFDYPNRFTDKRGQDMWSLVQRQIA